MDQRELLAFAVAAFDRCGIAYAITGSHASSAYGESRFTNDIDIVANISPAKLPLLISEFPQGTFYVSEDGARHAAANGGQFNIIDPESAQKIDVIIPSPNEKHDELARRRPIDLGDGLRPWFISPEDLILSKMNFYQLGGSEKHLRDIASMLKISGEQIDRQYISEWAERLNVAAIWQLISSKV